MSYTHPYPPRNVLSLVHSVRHYGGRIKSYLIGFSYPDKGLYMGLLGPDYGRFGFRGLELTECTDNAGAPDHARNGAPSKKMSDLFPETPNHVTQIRPTKLGFEPSPIDDVHEHLQQKDFVDVAPASTSIIIQLRDAGQMECFGGLYGKHGWIIEAVDFDRGHAIAVPATEPWGLDDDGGE